MKIDAMFRALTPLVAVVLAAGAAGCDGKISIDGEKGKPLSELDLNATPVPQELVLLGPDEIQVSRGDKLAISVEGDKAVTDQLRFTLKDGTLGVLRAGKGIIGNSGDGKAVVKITMPPLRSITMAGSGKISAAALAPEAKITVAGSGDIETPGAASEALDLTIAGSGSYRAGGTAKKLSASIMGSGSASMEQLRAEQAEFTIAGSGSAALASDGTVNAKIMGSGSVTVRGRAKCTVESMGSGKLICEAPDKPATDPDAG